ncbi:hypothetical protein KSP39_PZI018215 [Platanthera zijinensis]|uniref:RING-type E3 ubiquitin transferase n=1 Tax=Platanthera zijinensis TaxID=2320716 RepID=A0AAP0FZ46_9ASPA
MDQPFYQSNILLNSVEAPTLAEYLLSPDDTEMDYLNMASQDANGLDIWNSHDPTSSAYRSNQVNHDVTKMNHGWNTSLSINSVGEARMEERQCERNNIVSLESGDFNLNNTPSDDGHSFRQNLDSNHVNNRADNNVHAGPNSEFAEVSLCPFMPEFFEPEHVTYSNSHGTSSNAAPQVSENDNRARSSFDGQLAACKRKNIEQVIGESSTSRNISTDLSIPSSSRYLPASFLEDNQSPSFSPVHRGLCPEWNSTSSLSGNAETLPRNVRARLNPARLHDTSLFQPHSSNRLSGIWSTGEPSSILNPFNHLPEQIQPQGLYPVLPPNINHSLSSSRTGSSASPVYGQRRSTASPEQTNIRSLPRIGIVDQPAFFLSTTTVSQLVQDPPSWNQSNSSSSVAGNRASSSSGVIPSPGPIRIPSEMVPPQYHRNMSDILRTSLLQPGGSESWPQSSNSSSRQSGRPAAALELGQSSRIVLQGHSPLYPRAAVPVDRQRDGVSGLNFPARSREGRNRMISEIRNALDLMRRGVNLRFEDVFMFDQSAFYGRADLYDRHRDMRLDVDNMSYEELLALEERIGYVNTGLSEETILKRLRQRKYSLCDLVVASAEQEPCCICREDYKEGEEIVTLDCKHDFHTLCIKEWLMNKNLCPICKTTALVT